MWLIVAYCNEYISENCVLTPIFLLAMNQPFAIAGKSWFATRTIEQRATLPNRSQFFRKITPKASCSGAVQLDPTTVSLKLSEKGEL
jgi:hypothetical protein